MDQFSHIVGQEQVKNLLHLYTDSFGKTSVLPFLCFSAQKGGGKTEVVRAFKSGLKRPDGSKITMVEANGASLTPANFFQQIYPIWTAHKALLFVDEVHNVPYKLQELWLTLFNIENSTYRVLKYDGMDYNFDFTELAFVCATTDHQKLVEPLRDRLREVSFSTYSSQELYTIFKMNSRFNIDPSLQSEIMEVFRGNPRDVVKKAQELNLFMATKPSNLVTEEYWKEFTVLAGIRSKGLNHAEIEILDTLWKRGSLTLNMLAAVTGYSRSVIQNEYEKYLIKRGLMKIDGNRQITSEGISLMSTTSRLKP